MAATARFLLLAASCLLPCCLAANSLLTVDAGDFVEVDDGAANATAHAPSAARVGAAASVDLMAAEAAAGAAQAAGAEALGGSSAGEWEVEAIDDERPDAPEGPGLEGASLRPGRPPPPPAPPVAAPLDALMDFVMSALAHQVAANHSTERPVPDFSQRFKARLGPITVHGHLDANGGTIGDLSSLFRDGAVTLRKEAGGVLVLISAAGLRTLRVRYRHYSARAGPIRVSGHIEADASPVAVRAQLALQAPCRVQLRALALAQMGRVRVQASGLGALRRLLPLLQRWLDKRVRADVEQTVLPRIQQIVQAQLQQLSC